MPFHRAARPQVIGLAIAGGVLLLTQGRLPVAAALEPAAIRPTLAPEALARDFVLDGSGTRAARRGILVLEVAGKPGGGSGVPRRLRS